MKYCIFSDVHGNIINLQALFSCTQGLGIDKYICLGDLCNYFTDNKEVIELLKEREVQCILGNHDEMYLNPDDIPVNKKKAYNFDFSLVKSKFHIDFIRGLPRSLVIEKNGSKVLFCHGSPNNLTNGYIYPDSDIKIYIGNGYDFIFCGHTHRQFISQADSPFICNVGSVGMPRDNGLLFGFAVFDFSILRIQLYRKKTNSSEILRRYSGKVKKDVLELMERNEKIKPHYILI
jgi:predicted phosphodiesterase